MKVKSDNFFSSLQGIMKYLKGIEVMIYESTLHEENFLNSHLIKDLTEFQKISDLIITYQYTRASYDIAKQIYTPDLLGHY